MVGEVKAMAGSGKSQEGLEVLARMASVSNHFYPFLSIFNGCMFRFRSDIEIARFLHARTNSSGDQPAHLHR